MSTEYNNHTKDGSEYNNQEDVSAGELTSSSQIDEKKLDMILRKIDFTLLLILVISSTLNGMDRGNLGLSKVVGLEDDLGMSGSDFNIAVSAMYPTYLSFMLPHNIAIRKFGARIWLSFITVAWGVINLCMAFAKNKNDIIICRLFLGAAEAGFTPGVAMIISLWYPRAKITEKISFFYTSFAFSAIIGGPIASGLSKITNTKFKQWGWIFFIEGLFTATYGLFMFLFLSDYPDKSWVLSQDEKDILNHQLSKEQAGGGKRKVTYTHIVKHIKDPLIHFFALVLFCANFGISTILIFAPIIVKEMGFNSSASQAMQAVPGICALIGIVIARYYPNYLYNHCISSIFSAMFVIIGSVILLSTINNGARIFGLSLIGFGSYGNLCLAPGWAMSNVGGPTRSAVSGAVVIGYGGLGALCASYIYRNKDQPRYLFGHGMNLFGGLFSIVCSLICFYIISRRNREKSRCSPDISNMTQDEIDNLETDHPDFRYIT